MEAWHDVTYRADKHPVEKHCLPRWLAGKCVICSLLGSILFPSVEYKKFKGAIEPQKIDTVGSLI